MTACAFPLSQALSTSALNVQPSGCFMGYCDFVRCLRRINSLNLVSYNLYFEILHNNKLATYLVYSRVCSHSILYFTPRCNTAHLWYIHSRNN